MNKKNLLLLITSLATVTTCGVAVLVSASAASLLKSSTAGEDKTIQYHLADDAAKGEIPSEEHSGYTVTDSRNGYYYSGYVSKGTFSSNGLALESGEFYQADLKGATAVSISFSSGSFAIELSNDNANFSTQKQLATGGTYNFKVLMRYVRVLCTSDGTLTDVNLTCACSTNYYFSPDLSMSESAWSSNAKTNKVSLVGKAKSATTYDFNYLTINAVRDSNGLYVLAREKVAGSYFDSNNGNWWQNDNFEIKFNSSTSKEGRTQLYASTLDSNHGNFDVVRVDKKGKQTGYDAWNTIVYECFVTYDTLSELSGKTFNASTDMYLWYGFADGHDFNGSASWEGNATVKATINGIVDLSGNRYGTDYSHAHGGWDNRSEWTVLSNSLADGARETVALDSHAVTNGSESDAIGDVVWKTTLGVFFTGTDKDKGRVFRLDWYSFKFGEFSDSNVVNGNTWEYTSRCAGNENRFRYYETVTNSDIVYVFTRSGNTYKVTTCLFPNDPTLVGRDDYILQQSLDTTETMGAALSAEWTNYFVYSK